MNQVFEIGVPFWRRAWLHIVGWLALLFLIAPVLIVVPISFSGSQYLAFPPESLSLRWYVNYFDSIEWMDSTRVSIQVACATVILSLPLGIAASYGLIVSNSAWVKGLRAVIIAPMIVPIIIIAIGVFYLYARIGLLNTITGLVLAHTVLAVPFVMIVVTAGLSRFDFDQERAAVSLGANRFVAFLTVTLPQIKRSIFSAALIAMITSLDEVVVALFISLGERSTLTRRMFESLRDQVDPTIAAISTLLICLSMIVVVTYGFQSASSRRNR